MVGQVVTAGLDKKIMFWDIRMGRASGNLDAVVASMSLSGYDLIVAVGASVNMYDLRNLGRSVQSSELRMDVQIKCVSSIPYSRGIKNGGSHLCMSHLYQFCMSDSDFKLCLKSCILVFKISRFLDQICDIDVTITPNFLNLFYH